MCPAAVAHAVESSGSMISCAAPATTGQMAGTLSVNTPAATHDERTIGATVEDLLPEMHEIEVLERVRRRGALLSALCVAAPALALLIVALSLRDICPPSSGLFTLVVFTLACMCGSLIADLASFFSATTTLGVLAEGRALAIELSLVARSDNADSELYTRFLGAQRP